ncbi:MAG: winged helix-turn-helix domain-containing protein [Candidatus Bathyarchaeota archaeon]|nr:winged helix-turn-helix domain-containing protein [Candidatus Bathyarchaeota archaeon]
MSSNHNHKRDRIQIIADILYTCRSPQTQTYIRRQTCVSYAVLQSCLMQLRVRQWLAEVDGDAGQKKLTITQRGQVFLEKWFELQSLAGIKNKQLPHRVYLHKDLQLAAAN